MWDTYTNAHLPPCGVATTHSAAAFPTSDGYEKHIERYLQLTGADASSTGALR